MEAKNNRVKKTSRVFLAGAVSGEVQVSPFVAGAVFSAVQVSLFAAGEIFG